MTAYRKPRYATPLVPILERMIAETGRNSGDICDEVGLQRDTLPRWRKGGMPNVANLEAFFNYFGYSLVPVPGDGVKERSIEAAYRWDISGLGVGDSVVFDSGPGVNRSAYLQAGSSGWKVSCKTANGKTVVRRIS